MGCSLYDVVDSHILICSKSALFPHIGYEDRYEGRYEV